MLNSLKLQGNVACEHKATSGALFTLCSQAKGNEKTDKALKTVINQNL